MADAMRTHTADRSIISSHCSADGLEMPSSIGLPAERAARGRLSPMFLGSLMPTFLPLAGQAHRLRYERARFLTWCI
jgi:hypothetical protein